MAKRILPLVFILFAKIMLAQNATDTVVHAQQVIKRMQHAGVKKVPASFATAVRDSLATDSVTAKLASLLHVQTPYFPYRAAVRINPYFNFFGVPENRAAAQRPDAGKEALFYLMAGLLLFFALIKLLFNKYVNNLLGLVFRGSLRQKQIREQLLQTPLPSLFLNIFFVVTAGLYIFYLLQYYHVGLRVPFWLMLLYCVVAVALVYLAKFVVLKLTGWIFNMRDAADTYIFIVFLVNKLLAVFLLPLLIIMMFSLASWSGVLLTLSYIMVGGFFAYRYIVSFAPVRREVKVSQFHFFMYLCAFEILPLLLIYKVLVHFF